MTLVNEKSRNSRHVFYILQNWVGISSVLVGVNPISSTPNNYVCMPTNLMLSMTFEAEGPQPKILPTDI